MRILLAFVAFVALIMTVTAIGDGDWVMMAGAGAVAMVAGVFLWRDLRDPAKTRALGLRCAVTFLVADTRGEIAKGTLARVNTIHTPKRSWDVRLDRMPEGGDMDLINVAQRGWVWLGPDDLPERVKIDYGATWKTWDVLSAGPT